MQLSALFTIRKVWKGSFAKSISFQEEHTDVNIDQKQLGQYVELIGFQSNQPMTFLYVLAQRAQAALMLNNQFPFPMLGLVHLENRIIIKNHIDYNSPFKLITSVNIPFKETGSIIPVLEVSYFQHDKKVATCESTYLIRRKNKDQKKKAKTEVSLPQPTAPCMEWRVPSKLAKQYAKVSGDTNPIHTSTLMAKLFGFKQPILHGWCAASKVIQQLSSKYGAQAQQIEVQFKNPIYMGTCQQLFIQEDTNLKEFTLVDKKSKKTTLKGRNIL